MPDVITKKDVDHAIDLLLLELRQGMTKEIQLDAAERIVRLWREEQRDAAPVEKRAEGPGKKCMNCDHFSETDGDICLIADFGRKIREPSATKNCSMFKQKASAEKPAPPSVACIECAHFSEEDARDRAACRADGFCANPDIEFRNISSRAIKSAQSFRVCEEFAPKA